MSPEGGPDAVRLAALLETAAASRVFDLAQPFEPGMPGSPNHPTYTHRLQRRHGDKIRAGGGSSASDVMQLGGHMGTHIDALAHVSQDGQLHGGVDAAEAQQSGRFAVLGVDTIDPIVCRGVLLDVPSALGVDVLDGGYEITAADVEQTLQRQRVELEPGDAVLVRTGWATRWRDPAAFLGVETGVPGVGLEAAQLLCDRGARVSGSDTTAYEVIPPEVGHAQVPVHRLLLVEQGVYIIEMLQLENLARASVWEFLFVAVPLNFVGATGSPLRPLAIA